MKKTNTHNQIQEEALSMYKETVSPPKSSLINILNQIPEQEIIHAPRRVTRSPYMWVALGNMAIAFSLVIAFYPNAQPTDATTPDESFSQIDAQVDQFEASIDNEDALLAYNDSSL